MKGFLNQNNFFAKGLISLTQKVYNNSFLLSYKWNASKNKEEPDMTMKFSF